MALLTVTAYIEAKSDGIAVQDAVVGYLNENGIEASTVKGQLDDKGDRYHLKVRAQLAPGVEDEEIAPDDLAIAIWESLGEYAWLHIATQGKEAMSEKYAREEYQELMG